MGSDEAVLSLPRNGVLLKEVKWIVRWWWLQRPGQEDKKRAVVDQVHGHGHGEAADLTTGAPFSHLQHNLLAETCSSLPLHLLLLISGN